MLVPAEYLTPGSMGSILHTIDVSTPAERKSLLLVDLDFSDENLKEATIGNAGKCV